MKIHLNSLWGKFAQRSSRTETIWTNNEIDFHRWLSDPNFNVLHWTHVAENLDMLVVRRKPELCEPVKTNNLPVAAFVTSHARLRLYQYINQADSDGCSLLYCDTDSVIYAKKRSSSVGVVGGDQLGEMKRQMTDRRIVEFCFSRPQKIWATTC